MSTGPILYFDHNATSPMLPAARAAWLAATDEFIGNPSSLHRVGRRAETALDDARNRMARLLGCSPLDIVWTSGASESNNQVFHHVAATADARAEAWISGLEHPCVVESARHYFPGRVREIPTLRNGVADLAWLRENLEHGRPALVALMAANNVTGVLQPWGDAADLCRQKGVPYFCDAAQWLGREPFDGLGHCDYVSGCGHKAGGPRGAGFLKCPALGLTKALVRGGPQEEGRRAGTENVAGVAAMTVAFEERAKLMGERAARQELRDDFIARLKEIFPQIEIAGESAPRLWNTVTVLMPETDCPQRWVIKLDRSGFAVSTGSACASGKEEPSPALLAMGYGASEASRAVRISSTWETTATEWNQLLAAMRAAGDQLGVVAMR